MAENMIKFLRGNVASLPQTATAGAVYFTKDEGLYLGLEDGTYHRYGDFITVANVDALPSTGAHETCMYYCEAENILAKWDGAEWVQINKQKTLEQLGGVAKSIYEAKMALLEKADTDNATAVGNLTTYVGTIPATAEATNIVAYIQEKTAGIATDTALEELTGRVATAEGDIDKLEAALGAEGATGKAVAAAQTTAEAAQAAADKAQGDVDALAGKVGTVTGDKTVADLVEAAQAQADKGVADAATAQAKADSAYTLAEGKATMDEVNAAITGAGHAVKSEVDTAIENLGKAYVAADTALETKLQGNIDKKVAQADYDAKVALLEGADTTLQANIEAEAKTRKDADDAQVLRIAALEGQIVGLTGAMHFKGVENAIPEGEEALAGYVDGDVIIVGEKEYVFNEGAFVEFGDISAEGERIAVLEGLVGKEAEGENAATGLVKAVADNAAAVAAEKERAEAEEAKLIAADATNLQAAKDYADAAVEALGIGDYVKKADADKDYAAAGHNHDDKYDAKGDAAQALVDAKSYADGLKQAIDAAYAEADTALSNRIKDLEDNKAGYATTAQVDEAKTAAIAAAAEDAANKDAVVLVETQKGIAAVQTALDTYKTTNDAEVAKKANADDVYAKTVTYTKDEVDALIEAAHTWGTF